MDRNEAKILGAKLSKIADNIPRGLTHLNDAVSFACIDLTAYAFQGIQTKDFLKAVDFAKSIPEFKNLSDGDFTTWMLDDQEHLKYWPPY